ncbi:hypothetical protein MKW94_027978 [Papaver nudicaule]|uniref:Cytochrome P450 n=1 Tax=Papaver nudicaule TaxID=74823 RepID=A0AA41S0C1_PAPNU|nr:hypothetical protein [Papaver nudicaule]
MISINSSWISASVLFLITSVVVSLTHYWYKWSHPKCNGKLPPGSMGFPLIGETIQFLIPSHSVDIPPFVKKRLSKYGKIFRTSIAGQPVVVSADHEFNYHIIQQEGKFVQLWYMDAFTALFEEHMDSLNKGIIHKYMKRTMANYVGLERVKGVIGRMEVMANQGLRSWSATKSPIEFKSSVVDMVAGFTLKEFCDYDTGLLEEKMSKKFAFLESMMSIPVNIPGTAYHKFMQSHKAALKLVRDILGARIKSRESDVTQQQPQRQPMIVLDQLIDDLKTTSEEFITESFIVIFLFSILLATLEPVSSVLTLAMVYLTDNPLVVKELKEEYERVLKNRENAGSGLTWTEYKSMTFTHQVVNETLRMSNTVPGLLRKVIKDIDVNGYVIPEGWTLVCLPSCLHFDPEIHEDPLVFNPWRWNGKPPTTKNLLAFGGGIRNCVGADYAKVMIGVTLHVLITKFSWTKIKGGEVCRMPVLRYPNGFHVKITEQDQTKTKASYKE